MVNCNTVDGRLFAIYIDVNLWSIELKIAIHVLNQRQFPHRALELAGILIQVLGVGCLQRDLVRAACGLAANIDGRWILDVDLQTRFVGKARTQFFRDFICAELPLIDWLQADKKGSVVATRVSSSRSNS